MVTQAQFYGKEPEVKDKILTKIDLIKSYNWYNANFEVEVAKDSVVEYLTSIKYKGLVTIKKAPATRLLTLGWISRILLKGGKVPTETIQWYNTKLKELNKEYSVEKEVTETVNQGALIQQRLNEQFEETLGHFENMIDNWEGTFDPYHYLQSTDAKGFHAQRIADYYKPLAREVTEVLAKKDPQVMEAYAKWTAPQLFRYSKVIHAIISDCERYAGNAKIARKPRKKKAKAANKVVAKMKYKISDDRFKIRSINPEEIVGASQLWVFNTKTRKLGVYNALNNDRLSVKGTTILNYDPDKSIQKVVRKPDVVLNVVTAGGKVALRTVLTDINAVESQLNGRINADVVLMKAVKG